MRLCLSKCHYLQKFIHLFSLLSALTLPLNDWIFCSWQLNPKMCVVNYLPSISVAQANSFEPLCWFSSNQNIIFVSISHIFFLLTTATTTMLKLFTPKIHFADYETEMNFVFWAYSLCYLWSPAAAVAAIFITLFLWSFDENRIELNKWFFFSFFSPYLDYVMSRKWYSSGWPFLRWEYVQVSNILWFL